MKKLALAVSIATLLAVICACGNTDDSRTDVAPKTSADVPVVSTSQASFDPTYNDYATLLIEYVKAEKVDYAGLRAGKSALERIVNGLGSISPDSLNSFDSAGRLAFYINAYNAITLLTVVEHYPVSSIRDIEGAWDKRKWDVAGSQVTLNDIEHNILRKDFQEPRIHFAINCASIGCPPLKNIPYRSGALDEQLASSARDFLSNPAHASFDKNTGVLFLSEIFKWFGDDFTKYPADNRITAPLSAKDESIISFVAAHWPDQKAEELLANVRSIAFSTYDWNLNDIDR